MAHAPAAHRRGVGLSRATGATLRVPALAHGEGPPLHRASGSDEGQTLEGHERRFLEGPGGRTMGLMQAIRVFVEMIRSFRTLHFVGPCVTVFGSARLAEGDAAYELGRRTGAELARAGFTVMTGGGPGLMEAASRGAKEAGGETVGCGIRLVRTEARNPYSDTWLQFRYFFVRKLMLVRYSYAFVVLPGGFGTMDEVFESATLIQTGKIQDFPIVLMGSEYWRPLLDFVRDRMVARGVIDQADFDRFTVTDSPEDAAALVRDTAIRRFGVHYRARPRRKRILFE